MGGEDAEDALSCRSYSAKEPRIIRLFCGKWPIKITHPVRLVHSRRMPYLYWSFPAKEPLITRLFCGKWCIKIRHPMRLVHPVRICHGCLLQETCNVETPTHHSHTISIFRLLNIIGLFCKRALQKRRYSAKDTYNVETPTHHSHTISCAHAFVMAIFCTAFIILHTHMYIHLYIQDISGSSVHYGVATISLLLQTTSRFCRM